MWFVDTQGQETPALLIVMFYLPALALLQISLLVNSSLSYIFKI